MITDTEIKEIRKILESSKNPLFLFDNDPDGLCSYLLLKRLIKRGKYTMITGNLDSNYLSRVDYLKPDIIFVLDKSPIHQSFLDGLSVPVVWIDHHPLNKELNYKDLKIFNPHLHNGGKDSFPTSYWCYKIAQQDLWIAMTGCINDWTIPDFSEEFIKQYPDLFSNKIKEPSKALFETLIGKLGITLFFCIKNKSSELKKIFNTLDKIESPYEITNETTSRGKLIVRESKYAGKYAEKIIEQALETKPDGNLIVFPYKTTKVSLSGFTSNYMLYKFPDKYVIIAIDTGEEMICSFRAPASSKLNLPDIIGEALEGLIGRFGGHSKSCGGNISKQDFWIFIDRFKKIINKKEISFKY